MGPKVALGASIREASITCHGGRAAQPALNQFADDHDDDADDNENDV